MNASLLIFLAIIGLFYILFRKIKSTVKRPVIGFNSRKHFALIIGYIVFLLAILVTAEIVGQQYQSLPASDKLTTADHTELNYDQHLGIGEIDAAINASQLIEKRTHPASDTLTIQNTYNDAYIYIERKSADDDLIEEFLFKPTLLINEHNFSDKVHVEKPVWRDNILTIRPQPITDIRYARFYDSVLLNQITQTKLRSSSNPGYVTRQLVVYLLVPEGIEIETSSESTIQYVSD